MVEALTNCSEEPYYFVGAGVGAVDDHSNGHSAVEDAGVLAFDDQAEVDF